jgi:hypothetical protein
LLFRDWRRFISSLQVGKWGGWDGPVRVEEPDHTTCGGVLEGERAQEACSLGGTGEGEGAVEVKEDEEEKEGGREGEKEGGS